jgi:hypothetical protein
MIRWLRREWLSWRIRRVVMSDRYSVAMQMRDWDACDEMLDPWYSKIDRLREKGL